MKTIGEPHRPVDALFRLLEARLGLSAIGVFLTDADDARFWAGTEAFGALWLGPTDGSRGAAFAMPVTICDALAGAMTTRVDATVFGTDCRFAALAPILTEGRATGYLLVLDRRRRWLGPRAAADLREAAHLVGALIPNAPPAPPGPSLVARRTALTRKAAHSLIQTAQANAASDADLSLMLIDLDRFRAVNEALGASAGDTMLALTGTRLSCATEGVDRLERLEGDRFIVLSLRPKADLPAIAQRLLETVSEPLVLNGQTMSVQASIGMVVTAGGTLAAPDLLMQAETALRRAKAEGRNRFFLHGPRLEASTSAESRLELDLSKAVEAGQMRLVYQPYVDLVSNVVTGCEALIRWRHPRRGELPPAAFIPLAETSGQILALGDWALRTALRTACSWPEPLHLSVNVSALQFHQPDFTATVDAALASCDFPADRLELEITETVLMRDNPETIAQLRRLIARGIRIALDDFGTGYSALAYLARLPHHRIKLDRAFVQDLANPATADLIRAIITSARAQGIAVTAEGVERPEQVQAVRRMGFTHAQGFATGLPVADPVSLANQALQDAQV